MPLAYDEEIGEVVNVCIDCGEGPCSTFNDRCLRCHDAAMLPPELEAELEADVPTRAEVPA